VTDPVSDASTEPATAPAPESTPALEPVPATPPKGDKGGSAPPLFGGAGEIAKPGPGAFLSDFVDTRITFGLTDDDFLSDAGRTTPSSPVADFGPRRGSETFFNNLDRRDTLKESLSHLVIYRRLPGYFWGVDTEAAAVMRFTLFADNDSGKLGQSFQDDGSYLRTSFYPLGDTKNPDAPKFEATFFPFNTVRYRLGYLYDITWGGPEIFPSRGVSAPGLKLQVSYNDFRWLGGYAYVGAKTARLLDERINEMQANWGALAGVGVDIARVFSLEGGTGFFQRGTNPLTGVKGETVQGYGASGRAMLHINTPRAEGLDFRLMRNDLATANFFLKNKPWASTWSFTLAAEATWLQQTLQDPDHLQTTLRQNARAAALSARLKLWYFTATADAIMRDLAFVLYNRPGFVPFQAFPGDSERDLLGAGSGECPFELTGGPCKQKLSSRVQPELLGAVGMNVYIPVVRLTPGIIFGLQKPATFQGFLPEAIANNGVPDEQGSQTVVVRNASDVDILPCSEYAEQVSGQPLQCKSPSRVTPIFSTRISAKWDISDLTSLVADQIITVDPNRTELVDDVEGTNTTRRAFYKAMAPMGLRQLGAPALPLKWGGGIYVQSRF
jgi:hypothetical protein